VLVDDRFKAQHDVGSPFPLGALVA
jgi:hypothetical protein